MLRDHGAMALSGEGAKLLEQPRHDVGDLLHHQVGVEARIENQGAVGRHLLAQGDQRQQRLLVALQCIGQGDLGQPCSSQTVALALQGLEMLARLITDQLALQRLGRLLQGLVELGLALLQQTLRGILGAFPSRQQGALGDQLMLHLSHTFQRLCTFHLVVHGLQARQVVTADDPQRITERQREQQEHQLKLVGKTETLQ